MTDAWNRGSVDPGEAKVREYLALAEALVTRTAPPEGALWFSQTLRALSEGPTERTRGVAIGLAPRKLGKVDLALGTDDLARAAALCEGFDLTDWSVDQLARVAFMLAGYGGDDAAFAAQFDAFCRSAEINELIALCKGLPLYPGGALLEPRAREAVRSGMRPVFEAVAHRNPYPRMFFDEDAWNHMVVKAIFIEAPLWPIQGLDARGNPRLATMLVALAHERWAAQRPISREVWRCVAPHGDADGIAALEHVVRTGNNTDSLAVALALRTAPHVRLDATLHDRLMTLHAALDAEHATWRELA